MEKENCRSKFVESYQLKDKLEFESVLFCGEILRN
jgi:hypothetical protein